MNDNLQKTKMVLSEDEALGFFAFLIASARAQLDDPATYASMRLLTAFEDMRNLVMDRVSNETRNMLESTIDMTTDAQINMLDTDYYTGVLDELNRILAAYMVEQSDLGRQR